MGERDERVPRTKRDVNILFAAIIFFTKKGNKMYVSKIPKILLGCLFAVELMLLLEQ
jgi:hypothetical protein